MTTWPDPQIQMIPIDQIDTRPKPWHSVRYYFDSDITKLAAAIEHAGGVEQPVGLKSLPALPGGIPYRFEVIYGLRRVLAAQRVGMSEIPARVFRIDRSRASLLSLREDVAKKAPRLLERGWGFARLEDDGMSQIEIAAALAQKKSTVNEGIRFARAIPEALLLRLASRVAPNVPPEQIVCRAVHLSKRTLLYISAAMRRGDQNPLIRALEAIAQGKTKAAVTRAVRTQDQTTAGGQNGNANRHAPKSAGNLMSEEAGALLAHLDAVREAIVAVSGSDGEDQETNPAYAGKRAWARLLPLLSELTPPKRGNGRTSSLQSHRSGSATTTASPR